MIEAFDQKERSYYRNMFINKLTDIYSKFPTPYVFFDSRSKYIITRLLSYSELYGTGFT